MNVYRSSDDRWFVLTMTLNDPDQPFDTEAAVKLAQIAAHLLAQ